MGELVESFLSLTWELSRFGVRQTANLCTALASGEPSRLGAAAWEDLAWAAQKQLGATLREVFRAGDSLQRDALGLALPADLCSASEWMGVGAGLLRGAGESLRFLLPPQDALLAWREIANKAEVFLLVRQVGKMIDTPPPGAPFPLADLVARAYALGTFRALWAVEGLGHDYARHEWPEGGEPHALLTSGSGAALPAESLLMMHAGIGLGFAERRLAELPAGSPDAEVHRTVADVLALCRANSRPGMIGAALESLGLVTRTFHPLLCAGVDRALRELDPAAIAYYWHGVGRALYFLPVNFLPYGETTWRPFAMVHDEAPDETARRNALAGLGWAFTLVNMRHPEILARLLLRRHGAELAADDAFASGVASSLAMRSDTTPDGVDLLDSFLACRPAGSEPEAEAWDRLVLAPGRRTLAETYPALRRSGELGEIFRYPGVMR